MSSKDDGILSLKWKDKRNVLILSTYHDQSMVTKSRRSSRVDGGVEDIEKPKVVYDNNQHMCGVDKYYTYKIYCQVISWSSTTGFPIAW